MAEKQDPKADLKKESAKDDGLVEMRKGRETLRVHPDCVDAHREVGWED